MAAIMLAGSWSQSRPAGRQITILTTLIPQTTPVQAPLRQRG
jgi:hypothetical protein